MLAWTLARTNLALAAAFGCLDVEFFCDGLFLDDFVEVVVDEEGGDFFNVDDEEAWVSFDEPPPFEDGAGRDDDFEPAAVAVLVLCVGATFVVED